MACSVNASGSLREADAGHRTPGEERQAHGPDVWFGRRCSIGCLDLYARRGSRRRRAPAPRPRAPPSPPSRTRPRGGPTGAASARPLIATASASHALARAREREPRPRTPALLWRRRIRTMAGMFMQRDAVDEEDQIAGRSALAKKRRVLGVECGRSGEEDRPVLEVRGHGEDGRGHAEDGDRPQDPNRSSRSVGCDDVCHDQRQDHELDDVDPAPERDRSHPCPQRRPAASP